MDLKGIARAAMSENAREQALEVMLGVLREVKGSSEDEAIPNMELHDKRFHDGHYNEETMRCSLRERMSKSDDPDAELARHESVMGGLSNKKVAEYQRLMAKKCPQLDPEETLEAIAAIGDSKLQGDAFRWLMRGAVRLPEDMYKVEEARNLADKAKKDPLSYQTPQACINDLHGKFKRGSEVGTKAIDPDTVAELTDKRDMGYGVTTYLVQDDQEGQRAMRKIINTHWGEDANPWCLLHGDGKGNLSDGTDGGYDAWYYWNKYNALPKRVAFKDGKLLAFMATDDEGVTDDEIDAEIQGRRDEGRYNNYNDEYDQDDRDMLCGAPCFPRWLRMKHPEEYNKIKRLLTLEIPEQWWDRQDESHNGIPLGKVKIPSKRNAPAEAEIVKGVLKTMPLDHIGNYGELGYATYDTYDGMLKYRINKVDKDGEIVGFEKYDDGYLSEYQDDDLSFSIRESRDGQPNIFINDGSNPKSQEASVFFDANGNPEIVKVDEDHEFYTQPDNSMVYECGDFGFQYDKDGELVGTIVWDEDGMTKADISTYDDGTRKKADDTRKDLEIDAYAKQGAELLARSRPKFRWAVMKAVEMCQADEPKFPYLWKTIAENKNMTAKEISDLAEYLKRGY